MASNKGFLQIWRPAVLADLAQEAYWKLYLRATIDGCDFDLRALPAHIRKLMVLGKYESREREALRYIDPGIPAVELGACIGVISCLTNRMLRTPTEHVVFEPNLALRPKLEQNRFLNGASFEIQTDALAYGSDVVDFAADYDIHSSKISAENKGALTVNATTLKTILSSRNFQFCNLIVDIEGYEVELVKNEAETIKRAVKCLIMETHPKVLGKSTIESMLQQLKVLGFEVKYQADDVFALVHV